MVRGSRVRLRAVQRVERPAWRLALTRSPSIRSLTTERLSKRERERERERSVYTRESTVLLGHSGGLTCQDGVGAEAAGGG